jgi:hypothetical protein
LKPTRLHIQALEDVYLPAFENRTWHTARPVHPIYITNLARIII